MLDVDTIRASLDDAHVAFAADAEASARAELRPRTEPASDEAARAEAREILGLLGRGWLSPIPARDLRRIALAREAIAAASPLADAVYALQALGATPIVLAGDGSAHWVKEAVAGRAMGAFAMTEDEAGSD